MIRKFSHIALVCLLAATGSFAQSSSDSNSASSHEWVTVDNDVLQMSRGYALQGRMLEFSATGDFDRYETSLDSAMRLVSELLVNESLVEQPRFMEFYRSVVTEYEGYYGPIDTFSTAHGEIIQVRDELFAFVESNDLIEDLLIENLPELQTTIPIIHNSLVERSIVYLMRKPEKTVDLWRARAETYFPMIERILEEEGAPDELKYLALIESGLVPHAKSWARAAGMWQFISATGRSYGLSVTRWADERMDPEKATRAAARHLKDLYELFGHDWHLAMAGYNCSPARVKRAIRRVRRATGKDPTFFDIYRYLPRETRAYVPMFIAATIVMSHPDAFNLKDVEPGPRYEFDRVPVSHMLSLEQVASWTSTDVASIKALNPEIRKNHIPPSKMPYMLRIPLRTSPLFATEYDAWIATEPSFSLTHVVVSGETISKVARTYGVSTNELRTANGISGNTIHRGQELQIPVVPYTSKSSEEMFARGPESVRYRRPSIDPVAVATFAGSKGPGDNIQAVALRSSKRASQLGSGSSTSSTSSTSGNRVRYRVKRGDTLSGIAKKYGTSVSKLKGWNNVRGTRIKSGQVLTIYPGGSPSLTHKVQRGQTLSSIGRRYGVSVRSIKKWNGLRNDRIYVGQRLEIKQ